MSRTCVVGDLATARSGDKGNHANLGIVARDAEAYRILVKYLTADVVHAWLKTWDCSKVTRYELPQVCALNFVLENVLAGGASRSLRIDTQGKLLGTAALQIPLEIDN